jgi:hypothetical protein
VIFDGVSKDSGTAWILLPGIVQRVQRNR